LANRHLERNGHDARIDAEIVDLEARRAQRQAQEAARRRVDEGTRTGDKARLGAAARSGTGTGGPRL